MISKRIGILLFSACMFAGIFTANASAADKSITRCNVNSECRPGFVCVGGIANESYDAFINPTARGKTSTGATAVTFYGCCEPILPIRQICLFHDLMHGAIGHAIVILVVIGLGASFLFRRLDTMRLITVFAGIVCFYGSYQVVALLTGYDYIMCELVDSDQAPGEGCTILQGVDTATGETVKLRGISTQLPRQDPINNQDLPDWDAVK